MRSTANSFQKAWYKLTHWETWHWLVKYIPIIPAWLWYSIRSGSCWWFTPSNPSLTFGGFDGDTKREMYEQLPPGSYPKTIYITASLSFDEVLSLVAQHNFLYPFAVKPNIGQMGLMFRQISTTDQLKLYHEKISHEYIIQELITYPLEVSVFYYRIPGSQKGKITGFVKKERLQVTGDGTSTLLELMHNYDRLQFRMEEMMQKHDHKLYDVIPHGKIFILSHALNLSRGGKLVSLAHENDKRLLKVFDDLSHYTSNFYFGRYDIKCTSIEDLKSGKNFSILEYNGSGAEPHHIYGNGITFWKALGILLSHWEVLYLVSAENHRRGIPYWKFHAGWKFLLAAKKQFYKLKRIDATSEI